MYLSVPTSLSLLFAVVLIASREAVSAGPVITGQREYSNRIVFIRHAEKGFDANQVVIRDTPLKSETNWWPHLPPWFPGGGRGKFPNGLSEEGKQRAQFLRILFGNESEYDFGLIFAAPRTPEEKESERTYATVAPLADDLGLEVNIDCANADASCIAKVIARFAETSDTDILISWKHRDLNIIATALGAPNAKRTYPDERNDIIWIMQHREIVEKRSQHCPCLDDTRIDRGDPDLEVEAHLQLLGELPLQPTLWWDILNALWR